MKKSTRSALLSALVFPGVGHLYLKQYIFAALLSIGAAVATYFIVWNALQVALELARSIEVGNVPPEIGAITELLSKQSIDSDGSTKISMIALLIFWVIGVLDSFRVGHMLDKSDR